MRRSGLDVQEISRLYRDDGMRGAAIASLFGCSETTVYAVIRESGIRPSSRARLDLDEAIALYEAGWPATRIGEKYGVAAPTVREHLRRAGLSLRSQVESRQPSRVPCPRSLTYRAYLLGLVWGDFLVECHGVDGQTISVRTNTTCEEQIQLAHEVLCPFGPVKVSGRTVRASLGMSFSFLQAKYGSDIPKWVSGPKVGAAFAAGYADAEGSFGVYAGRGRFKLDSCDVSILEWFDAWARASGIRTKYWLLGAAGSPLANGKIRNRDTWRINVNDAMSLLRLVATLEPFARHARRRQQMSTVRDNILARLEPFS